MKTKLAINGFGRIGRSFIRVALKDREFMQLIDIVGINDTADAKTLAHLLKYDSVFGRFDGTVEVNDNGNIGILLINNLPISVISEEDPANSPWKSKGIDIVLESSGKFNDAKEAQKHIEAGAKKVIISAPAKQPDATILMGINDKSYNSDKHNVISMASCTTNCLAPVIKVLNDTFGIESGYMTTTHAYTNDQRLLDLPHKDLRRARSSNDVHNPNNYWRSKGHRWYNPGVKWEDRRYGVTSSCKRWFDSRYGPEIEKGRHKRTSEQRIKGSI